MHIDPIFTIGFAAILYLLHMLKRNEIVSKRARTAIRLVNNLIRTEIRLGVYDNAPANAISDRCEELMLPFNCWLGLMLQSWNSDRLMWIRKEYRYFFEDVPTP